MDVVQGISVLPNNDPNLITRRRLVSLKEVQAMFRPFHVFQYIYFLSKYQIRGNLAVQNSLLYNVFSGIFTAAQIAFIVIANLRISYSKILEGMAFVKFFCDLQEVLLLCLGALVNFITNVVKAPTNVLLPPIIQNLCEIIRSHERKYGFKKFAFISWIYVVYSVLSQSMWIIFFKYTFYTVYEMDQVISYVLYVIYDVNILYGARIIKLARDALKIWIDDARNSEFVDDSERDEYFDRLFTIYVEIFEAYKIVADAIHPLVLFFYIKTLDNTVFALYIRIEIFKTYEDGFVKLLLTTLMSLFWLYKDIFLLVTFSFVCEKFYCTLKEVQSVCVQMIASRKCSEAQRRICKNIIRHQEVSFAKVNACGLFVIDASLILQYGGILTTYVIVVFQFEFL